MESLFLLREDIDQHTSVLIPLTKGVLEQRICDQNNTLCCYFRLDMSILDHGLDDVRDFVPDWIDFGAIIWNFQIGAKMGSFRHNLKLKIITKSLPEILQVSSCGLQHKPNSEWHWYRNCYNLLYRGLHRRPSFQLWLSLPENHWSKRCCHLPGDLDFRDIPVLAKRLLHTEWCWHFHHAPKSIGIFIFQSWSWQLREIYWDQDDEEKVQSTELWHNWSPV